MQDVVELINDWGTVPLTVGHRDAPGTDPRRTGIADRLHDVFAAGLAERVRMVDAMLAETGVRPALTESGGQVTAGWTTPDPADGMLASAALALREHLAAHPGRMGVCADRQCADVYVDASPAGHRRFCSTTCQTRSRVAAFRERRRGKAVPDGN